MRTFIFLAGLCLAAAQEKEANCIVNGGQSASDLLDGAVYIWASIDRCGQGGDKAKCTIDITSAIESITSAIDTILKTVNSCGQLNIGNKGCVMASDKLVSRSAGLVAASTETWKKCGKSATGATNNQWVKTNYPGSKKAMCVVNLKGSIKTLLASIKSLQGASKACKDGEDCTENALRVVRALSGLGQYLSGVVGYCAPSDMAKAAKCSHAVNKLVSELSGVAEVGLEMSSQCGESSRLYLENGQTVPANNGVTNLMTLALVAFLPITAVMSFVGGSRFAKARSSARDMEAPAEE